VTEQLSIFPDIPAELWDGRRFMGRRVTHSGGGLTAAVRTAVFKMCVAGHRVTTDSTGHPQARVRGAFHVLERERMIKIGKKPCRNPHGYRLVARLHPRLKHLKIRK